MSGDKATGVPAGAQAAAEGGTGVRGDHRTGEREAALPGPAGPASVPAPGHPDPGRPEDERGEDRRSAADRQAAGDGPAEAGGRAGDEREAEPGGAASWPHRLVRFGYIAPPRTPLRHRLVPPMPGGPDAAAAVPSALAARVAARLAAHLPAGLWAWLCRRSSWLGPIAVALFAGVLRFHDLGSPNAVIFDETYYAKDAWALLHHGYEVTWPGDANQKLVAPTPSIPMGAQASYVVHPPIGKYVIALGEWVFGMHPFGWRFSVALLGTLSVLMIARIARRLLRSTLLGCTAGLLLAVDGLHFVMSRTALLDLIVMFWVLAAFGLLLLDRDRTRAGIADALARADGTAGSPTQDDPAPDPALAARLGLGLRPFRLLAGVCLGLACATKWNGLFVLAAFGVMTVLWDAAARRLAGAAHPYRAALRRDALPALASTVVVSLAVYLASWAGWFATSGGYFRQWAAHRGGATWVPAALRSLWHYHVQVYEFHTHLTTPHTYQSNPWSWLVLGRPVSYFYEAPKAGTHGCTAAAGCAREVLGIGTPLLWWTGVVALAYLLFRWALRRDWRAGAVLCGLAAGYLPWFNYQQRTIFLFYAVVFVPFLVLAVTMMLGALVGPSWASWERRIAGTVVAGVLVLAIVWNFLFFYPILTGETIPMSAWRARMWFTTWI